MKINKTEIVEEQYKDSQNLNIRISIHQKYSTNKQGFGNWILKQYEVYEDYRILELGCGKGDLWNNFNFPKNSHLIQTDFSNGMVEEAKKNSKVENVTFNQVDIQKIPYDSSSFDMVVANMMLYHVPNLDKGLNEVSRVLKNGGKFYTTTYGENGIMEYVQSLLKDTILNKKLNKTFTLQNGENILSKYFNKVEMIPYIDSLEVTDSKDLVDYIFSMTDMVDIDNYTEKQLFEIIENQKQNGKITVPKEYGIFICTL